jgi:hypothetical protein
VLTSALLIQTMKRVNSLIPHCSNIFIQDMFLTGSPLLSRGFLLGITYLYTYVCVISFHAALILTFHFISCGGTRVLLAPISFVWILLPVVVTKPFDLFWRLVHVNTNFNFNFKSVPMIDACHI